MRVQRAHQRTALALRAQRRVDLEEGLRGHPHHLPGHPGFQRVGVGAHEDDVDVGDVVQFARTAFAHRDDRQGGRGLVGLADGVGRVAQRGGQRGVGQVRQMDPDRGERQHRFVLDGGRQIEGRQHQDPIAVQRAQLVQGCRAVVLVEAVEEHRLELGRRRQRRLGVFRSLQQPPGLRVGHQVIAERQRRTQHREQATAQGLVLLQRGVQLVPVGVERLGQSHDGAQRGVGIGGARQRPQQFDVRVGVPAEAGQIGRGGALDESEPPHPGHCGTLRHRSGHGSNGSPLGACAVATATARGTA